ncbi:MAG: HEAT repeat domain-containing protein [Planctomycetes bacterium]|nr:HEAT repeat domain-containing protein [Planctomycetota bacterium]
MESLLGKSRYFILGAFCLLMFSLFNTPFLPIATSQDDAAQDEQIRQLFKEVKTHMDKEEYEEAYKKCEQALRMNPAEDFLRFLRDELGEEYLRQMLSKPETYHTALRIMQLAKGVLTPLILSTEEIQALVNSLDTDSITKKWDAVNRLACVGQRVCPYLIENLGNELNARLRANSIHCLEKMGIESVLPIIEALNSKNRLVRQNATIILGTIKDKRAVPELKRVLENPEELSEVKTYVADALQKITGKYPETLPSAKELYYSLAEEYYYSHPSVMLNLYGTYIVWRWDVEQDKITSRDVPEFSYNEELAEECCYDALKLDQNFDKIIPLLINVNMAQLVESDLGLAATQLQLQQGEVTEEIMNKLKEDLKPSQLGSLFGAMGSRKYLYQALARCLTDRNVLIGVACVDALYSCATDDDLPLPPIKTPTAEELNKMTPEEKNAWVLKRTQWEQESMRKPGASLVKALDDEDKRIRYAAARLILKIAPRRHFPGDEKVMPVILEALGESGVRVVLIIEDNEEIRARLKKELLKLNCFPVETMTGKDGLLRAKKFPSEDLIILNAKIANQVTFSVVTPLGTEVVETVFDSLKKDLRTKDVPVFLLTDKDNVETVRSVFKEEAQAYLVKPIDRVILEEELNKAFSSEKAQRDSKARAEEIARLAAESLANLDLVNCVYPYLSASDALLGSLESRPDEIRIPVLKAIGRFGDKKSIDPLTRVFHNMENKPEIRIASCDAMAEIFRFTKESIPLETYKILKDGIQESDFAVQSAVARVFGNAVLTPEQRREIFEIKRLHPK